MRFDNNYCDLCSIVDLWVMRDFAAIDLETANECLTSICSVGVVVVRGGEIAERFYSLVRPEPDYYKWFCCKVHGLSDADTYNVQVFPYVWRQIEPLIDGLPLVAHNAMFDRECLKAAHRAYGMDYPDYEFLDTLNASRRFFGKSLPNLQLQTVARACGHELKRHHHALADAEACAMIALKIL